MPIMPSAGKFEGHHWHWVRSMVLASEGLVFVFDGSREPREVSRLLAPLLVDGSTRHSGDFRALGF